MSYQNYFIYKGVAYGIGTKVIFSNSVNPNMQIILRRKTKEEIKAMPHTFTNGSTTGYFNFSWYENGKDYSKYHCFSRATIWNPDEDIKEIVYPVYVKLVTWQEKALHNMIDKTVSPDVFGGVLLYIVIMLIGAIFVDRLLIWLLATAIFIGWLLNQYRD